MTARILDGDALASPEKARIRGEAAALARRPGLAVLRVGEDPASLVYAQRKREDCAACGFYLEEYALPAGAGQRDLLALVELMNAREDIDGILVELPLPAGFDLRRVLAAVSPDKDVDGQHPLNAGRLLAGEDGLRPCTPSGVLALLEGYGIDPAGRRCTVVGRSALVGKPLALMLLSAGATVTVCHTGTPDLAAECRGVDILLSAAGRPGLVTGDMVGEGAVAVDVSVNRGEDGALCGDICFAQAAERASWITPVPGGVGSMTRVALLRNVLRAARAHLGTQ